MSSTESKTKIDQLVREAIALNDQKLDLEAELRKVQSHLTDAKQRIAEEFGLAGIQNINMDGNTVYRARDLKVSVKPDMKQRIIEVAAELGMEDMLQMQPMRLKAYVREQMERTGSDEQLQSDAVPLEPALANCLNVYQDIVIRIKKS